MYLFNEKNKNVLSNFKPSETIVCDDRDPPWINSKIKNLSVEKNIAKKCYLQNNSTIQFFRQFQSIQNLLTATIEKIKRTVLFSNLEKVNGSHSKPEVILIDIENVIK